MIDAILMLITRFHCFLAGLFSPLFAFHAYFSLIFATPLMPALSIRHFISRRYYYAMLLSSHFICYAFYAIHAMLPLRCFRHFADATPRHFAIISASYATLSHAADSH